MSSRTEKIIFGVLFSVILLLGGVRFWMDGTPTSATQNTEQGKNQSGKEDLAFAGQSDFQDSAHQEQAESVRSNMQTQNGHGASTSPKMVTVYVGGAVQKPGLYTLSAEKRIADALQAAGNLTKDGAMGALNPAMHLSDEMNIVVPTKEEVSLAREHGSATDLPGKTPSTNRERAQAPAGESKININTATAEELQRLPSIGKTKAENILRYREKTPFQTEQDIMNVSGIGQRVFEQIEPQICVK